MKIQSRFLYKSKNSKAGIECSVNVEKCNTFSDSDFCSILHEHCERNLFNLSEM